MNKSTNLHPVVRVQVSNEAKVKLDGVCERRGMTQVAVLSRLIRWFVEQDDVVQVGCLGQLSADLKRDLARAALERMAGDGVVTVAAGNH
jgi:hypothetical protein